MHILEKLCPETLRLVTVSKRFRMDCETPVSLYLKLALDKPYSFILESVDHGQHSGRFSFVGWDPILQFIYRPNAVQLKGAINGSVDTDTPLELLKQLVSRIDLIDGQDIPNARGGLVGHIAYDAIRLVEEVGAPHGEVENNWIDLMLPRVLLVFDHLSHVVTVLSHAQIRDNDEQSARGRAEWHLSAVLERMRLFSVNNDTAEVPEHPIDMDAWDTNMNREKYCKMVERAKQHIIDGDIFQVVLSRIARRKFEGEPFEIYRVLRQINPSPYMFYLRQEDRVIVGGSPEALVTVDRGRMTTRPIAGTRPRGKDVEEDLALEKDLLADEKEVAEHVMLVDLGRNDLGRVAEPGTVTVPRFMQIERYSHVMHIVSLVQAQIRKDLHPIDALMSVFPAGTLSGAPKIRAMQIINDFEPEDRDVYGGAIGFFDFDGNLDSCIAIRTATVENGEVRVQAGAGIVADSVPDKEFDETNQKMMSIVTAVERANYLANQRG